MIWSDKQVKTLKTLWAEGVKTEEIRKRLGGITKNSVIGKVHSLGLPKRRPRNSEQKKVRETKTKNLAPATVKSTSGRRKSRKRRTQTAGSSKTLPGMRSIDAIAFEVKKAISLGITDADGIMLKLNITVSQLTEACKKAHITSVTPPKGQKFKELSIPLKERATILTLTATTCRWPIGFPDEKDFHFCGKHCGVKVPYCDFHMGVASQPLAGRRLSKRAVSE